MALISVSALPQAWVFDPGRTALLVIDMQRDFMNSGGFGEMLGNNVSQLCEIIPTTVNLLKLARNQGWLVVHTKESHLPDLSDCPASKLGRCHPLARIGDQGSMGRILIRGEFGNDFLDAVAPTADETVICKPGKSAFYRTQLDDELRAHNINYLIFAGVTTDVCVQTTMRDANDRGYDCLLIEDATASYYPEFKTATLAMIISQNAIVGWTTKFEDLEHACSKALKTSHELNTNAVKNSLIMDAHMNIPEVVAEVEKVFSAYELALLRNDVKMLNVLFWDSPRTVRYGVSENLYGSKEICAWRLQTEAIHTSRRLHRPVITTFGRNFATVSVEFSSDETHRVGRQMQTWVRISHFYDDDPTTGWKIVAAHVSLINE